MGPQHDTHAAIANQTCQQDIVVTLNVTQKRCLHLSAQPATVSTRMHDCCLAEEKHVGHVLAARTCRPSLLVHLDSAVYTMPAVKERCTLTTSLLMLMPCKQHTRHHGSSCRTSAHTHMQVCYNWGWCILQEDDQPCSSWPHVQGHVRGQRPPRS